MRRTTLLRAAALAAVAALGGIAALPGTAAAAPSHAQISGTGSSWSANAVNQWVSDVSSSGLRVDFTGSGSAQGRKDFANGITDFAVSDIGYQGHDPLTGEDDTNCIPGQACRQFAYEPIVAGGTAFPYQVKVNGRLLRNLRLSGQTLAKIFTYKITNWDDPAISADNNGRKLPSLKIIPVVHSEGSGSTAQFTTYLAKQFPALWSSFTGQSNFTEYYPPPKGGQGIAQSGSDGVMNFLASDGANGAIGYDEYSYALAKNFPVAKILNRAGYYTLPDEYNVAVALQHAQINMNKSSPDYLLQKLDQVYTAPEKQAYPLSSYSYFLIPTGTKDPRMTTAKRQTLADYLYYSVCQGQEEIGHIGYSPLPINLVQASFAQTAKLKSADPGVDLTQRNVTTCNNPTFVKGHPEINHLAQIAPLPPACDRQGAGPCGDNVGTNQPGGTGSGTGTGNGAGNGSGNGGVTGNGRGGTGTTGATGGTGTTGGTGGGTIGATGGTGGGTGTKIDPDTGAVVGGDTTGGGGGNGNEVLAQQIDLRAYRQPDMTGFLGPLAVVELVLAIAVPPLLYYGVVRRRRSS